MTPEEFLDLATAFAEEPGTAVLFSGGAYDSVKRSFIQIRPEEKIWIDLSTRSLFHEIAGERVITPIVGNPWNCLREKMCFKENEEGLVTLPEWIGYFAYEMGAYADSEYQLPHHPLSYPAAYFQRGGVLIEYDHLSGSVHYHTALHPIEKTDSASPNVLTIKKALDSKEEYIQKVLRAKELILEGEIYQVNLSHTCVLGGVNSPFALYQQLLQKNPVPFSAFLSIDSTFSIVSLSPERFLSYDNKKLEARPIKGTVPRGTNEKEDALLKEQLLASEKERAELLMITDLMRNDLGKISKPGTVETIEFSTCEAYAAVYHLHSIIHSVPQDHQHPIDLVRACFPGGSITGCPKLRSMEVIDAIEQRARGIYTGAIGYFTASGAFDFNIAIRTLAVVDGDATLSLGGGIVADSIPSLEYEETLHKGSPFFISK